MDELDDFLSIFEQPEPTTPKLPDCSTDDPLESYLPEPPPAVAECLVPTCGIDAAALRPYAPFGIGDERKQELLIDLAGQLLQRGPFSLVDLVEQFPFDGDGVYTLYYHGDLPIYGPVKSLGSTYPIYVGKSARPGRRQGNVASGSTNLYHRLVHDHCKSLNQVGLGLEDFSFRFLLTPTLWVDLVEEGLIDLLQPLWNVVLTGFGARYYSNDQRRNPLDYASAWDTLHPGRMGAGVNPRPGLDVPQLVDDGLPGCLRAYREAMASLRVPEREPEAEVGVVVPVAPRQAVASVGAEVRCEVEAEPGSEAPEADRCIDVGPLPVKEVDHDSGIDEVMDSDGVHARVLPNRL